MKPIFLDFDGVILPIPANGEFDPNPRHSPEAVNNLNILVQVSGASVVVSSTWRLGRTVEQLQALLRGWGFKFQVYGKTDDSSEEEDRGKMVVSWLAKRNDVSSFVVVDDDATDLAELAKNHVMPKPDVGLQFHDAVLAVRILAGSVK